MPAYDLEQRTFEFAVAVRIFIKSLPRNTTNYEDGKQVIRSSGSVGANYIEANENLGQKDFKMRLKIARKEAKETSYWLKIIKATTIKIEFGVCYLEFGAWNLLFFLMVEISFSSNPISIKMLVIKSVFPSM